jgi:hypothetical protein
MDKGLDMPGQPRLDVRGTLQHVMGRIIEKMMIRYPAAQVTRSLDVTTSAVVRAADADA